MNLFQWLAWIFQSGGSVILSSWILERVPQYQNIPDPEVKKYWFWAISTGLSAIAYAAVTYIPMSLLEAVAPYFGFAYGTFAVIFLGTAFHFFDKSSKG